MRSFLSFWNLAMLGLMNYAAFAATLPPVIRGANIVWLRVEPGPLQLKLLKRDLNIYEDEDILQARLFDAQRRLVALLELRDDGLPQGKPAAEWQIAEASLPQALAGTYLLQVSGSGDCVWGLQSNAPGAVVQSIKEILLNDGAARGALYFMPPAEKFTIKAQALHDPGRQQMPLYDETQQMLKMFNLQQTNVDDELEVPAGPRRGLWRFDIAHMDVKISCSTTLYWTLDESAWHDVSATRWMLLPYRQARYLQPGQSTQATFYLRNSTKAEASFSVQVQAPPEVRAVITEPLLPVALKPAEKRAVVVLLHLLRPMSAGTILPVIITASCIANPEITACAGVEVRSGLSPVRQKLNLPIVLRPYEHESFQFGYAPDYEPNEIYFDRQNRPYIRHRTDNRHFSDGIQVLEQGRWQLRSFVEALRTRYPTFQGTQEAAGFQAAKIAFDADGWAYTILRIKEAEGFLRVLLVTPDRGHSWQIYELPQGDFDIEQFTGHNALLQPPPILCYAQYKAHHARFAAYHNLLLFMPRKQKNTLILGEPVKITDNCIGSCQHSGAPASTVTLRGKTHIVWGEIAPDDAPGVPTYVATFTPATGHLSEKVLLGYAPPVNDVHNVPAICADSQGYLHVILGAHGEPFQYVRSLKPNDASAWTKPEPVLTAGYVAEDTDADGSGRQTYCSLVCGPDDTLHIAFRQWRRNADDFHPGSIYAALSVQHKPKNGPWSPAQPLVIPPVPGYSIYYHKLTIDRRGRLYLAYSYWTSHIYQQDWLEWFHNRAIITSKDGGRNWKLLETKDF